LRGEKRREREREQELKKSPSTEREKKRKKEKNTERERALAQNEGLSLLSSLFPILHNTFFYRAPSFFPQTQRESEKHIKSLRKQAH
jgi:hypothetical protein